MPYCGSIPIFGLASLERTLRYGEDPTAPSHIDVDVGKVRYPVGFDRVSFVSAVAHAIDVVKLRGDFAPNQKRIVNWWVVRFDDKADLLSREKNDAEDALIRWLTSSGFGASVWHGHLGTKGADLHIWSPLFGLDPVPRARRCMCTWEVCEIRRLMDQWVRDVNENRARHGRSLLVDMPVLEFSRGAGLIGIHGLILDSFRQPRQRASQDGDERPLSPGLCGELQFPTDEPHKLAQFSVVQ